MLVLDSRERLDQAVPSRESENRRNLGESQESATKRDDVYDLDSVSGLHSEQWENLKRTDGVPGLVLGPSEVRINDLIRTGEPSSISAGTQGNSQGRKRR